MRVESFPRGERVHAQNDTLFKVGETKISAGGGRGEQGKGWELVSQEVGVGTREEDEKTKYPSTR